MIRSAKNVLSVLLKKQGGRIDTSNLHTMKYEVAAIVNSRPLGMVDENGKPPHPEYVTDNEVRCNTVTTTR